MNSACCRDCFCYVILRSTILDFGEEEMIGYAYEHRPAEPSNAPQRQTNRPRRGDNGTTRKAENSPIGGLLHLNDSGVALPEAVRARMQLRFGHDFAHVRIHHGPEARRAAQDVGAVAFTTGNDIVLGPEAPAPASESAHVLLAHELAHVVQQRQASRVVDRISAPCDAAEIAADAAARGTGRSRGAFVGGPVPAIQRQAVLGKERMHVKREEVERILADWLVQVLDAQGRQKLGSVDLTPPVIDAIISLWPSPWDRLNVMDELKRMKVGVPAEVARRVAVKLPAEIPEDRLQKIGGKPTTPTPDKSPNAAGAAAASVVVDSTVAPAVRKLGLSKDKQDAIIAAAKSAVVQGIVSILDQALDAAGVVGPGKASIHAAFEAAIKQQPGKPMERQQEGAGSPYHQEMPPSAAPRPLLPPPPTIQSPPLHF
jgi:Domain of unknown function (DUF4157)